jgi:hypothetical protein
MKRILILIFFAFLASCQNKVPFSSKYAALATEHQRIAILPFKVRFNEGYKQIPTRTRRNPDEAYWQEQQRLAGLDMQKSLFTNMAKQVEKGRYEKVIQDYTTTNKMLETAGITFYDLAGVDKARIAAILGVDAVIWGDTEIHVTPPNFGFPSGRDGAFTMTTIYDAASGLPVWQKEVSVRPSSYMDTPKRLGDEIVNSLSKMLPY